LAGDGHEPACVQPDFVFGACRVDFGEQGGMNG